MDIALLNTLVPVFCKLSMGIGILALIYLAFDILTEKMENTEETPAKEKKSAPPRPIVVMAAPKPKNEEPEIPRKIKIKLIKEKKKQEKPVKVKRKKEKNPSVKEPVLPYFLVGVGLLSIFGHLAIASHINKSDNKKERRKQRK